MKINKIVISGCFDVIHRGHIEYFKYAKSLGDYLIVGLNSDESIKQLKGPTRPINNEQDRKIILESIKYIDKVIIFNEKRATKFLDLVKPDIWCKGGDYTLETLDQDEKNTVLNNGGKIVFFDYLEGYSSTKIIDEM